MVGCGRIVEKHLQALRDVSGTKLVAVCDRDLDKAEEKGEKYGVPSYQSLSQMMEQEKLDVVSVLTPSGDHADTACTALSAGAHVLVEKPMAISMTDAERMILRADAVGRRLFVVKQNRYNKPVAGRVAGHMAVGRRRTHKSS